MKKALLTLVLLSATTSMFAQDGDREYDKWSGYMKVGYGWFIYPDNDESKSLNGCHFELGGIYNITDNIPLSFGVGVRQGVKSRIEADTKLYTVHVPVNIGYRVRFPNCSHTGFTVRGGIYGSYAVKGENKIKGYGKAKFKEMDGYHEFAGGVNAGLTFHIGTFDIFGEYGYGLIDRFKDSQENYFTVGIGWTL